ncbi:MAG: hypothetical protein NTY72_05705 [Bacteroidetes bacterium]|nr:hypothetical protein [Bacteroidota bacterium]
MYKILKINYNNYFLATLFCFITVFITSCNKESQSSKESSESLPKKGDLISFYKTLDPAILKSSNETITKVYLDKKSNVINEYIKLNYGEDFLKKDKLSNTEVILFGFVIATHELNDKNIILGKLPNNKTLSLDNNLEMPIWAHCAIAAVSGYEGFEKLFTGTATLMSATEALVVMKAFLKRYVGYIGIALAVYEFGTCMEWY